ncbi:unnamed protein product, partial [Phaeothamnion confervicola]
MLALAKELTRVQAILQEYQSRDEQSLMCMSQMSQGDSQAAAMPPSQNAGDLLLGKAVEDFQLSQDDMLQGALGWVNCFARHKEQSQGQSQLDDIAMLREALCGSQPLDDPAAADAKAAYDAEGGGSDDDDAADDDVAADDDGALDLSPAEANCAADRSVRFNGSGSAAAAIEAATAAASVATIPPTPGSSSGGTAAIAAISPAASCGGGSRSSSGGGSGCGHVRVGVGVVVTCVRRHPGCVLVGRRRGSHGAGMLALPGGHLEAGESWQDCALRELEEETGLCPPSASFGWVTNDPECDGGGHYVTLFMQTDVSAQDAEPELREPHKCDGWEWMPWSRLKHAEVAAASAAAATAAMTAAAAARRTTG